MKYIKTAFSITLFSALAMGKGGSFTTSQMGYSISPQIMSISEDSEGNIWFGANTNALSVFKGGNWTEYPLQTTAYTVEAAPDGTIWFGSSGGSGGALYSFNPKLKTETPFPVGTGGTADGHIQDIYFDSSKTAWVAVMSGVSSFDGKSWKSYTPVEGLSYQDVHTIIPDRLGALWFAANNGVSQMNGSKFTPYPLASFPIKQYILSGAADSSGTLWFGHNSGGVSAFDGIAWKAYKSGEGVVQGSIKAVMTAKDSSIWFGSDGYGVSRYDGKSWTTYTNADGLINNSINTIYQDKNGVIWFGTDVGVSWSDFRIDSKYRSIRSALQNDDTIGTVIGTFETITAFLPEDSVTYTLLSGDDLFTVSADTLRLKRALTKSDTTAFASAELSKNGQKDTVNISVPVQHWVQAGTSQNLKIEMPSSEIRQSIPSSADTELHLRLSRINNFSATASLTASKGILSKSTTTVPVSGEFLTLKIPSAQLKSGENIITVTAVNGASVLGTAVCTLDVKEVFSVTPSTIYYADTLGEKAEFTVSLTDFGKSWFAGEDISVTAAKRNIFKLANIYNNETAYEIKDTAAGTVLYKGLCSAENDSILQECILPSGREYSITLMSLSTSGISGCEASLTPEGASPKVSFSSEFNYSTTGYTDSDGKLWTYYIVKNFSIPAGAAISKLTSPFTDSEIKLNITADADTSSQIAEFTGTVSGKRLSSPVCMVMLPYQFISVTDSAPYQILGGAADTVSGDLWVIDSIYYAKMGLSRLSKGVWTSFTKSSTSGKLLSDTINTIAAAPDGKIWIGTPQGISIYGKSGWETPIFGNKYLTGNNVTDIRFNANGDVYVRSTQWDKYSSYWFQKIDSSEVPSVSASRSKPLARGFAKVEGQYGYSNKSVKYYTLTAPKAPTGISLSRREFIDSLPAGIVGMFSSVDANSSEQHSYELLSGSDLFEISGDTLKAKTVLKKSASITVKSTDERGLSVEKTIVISKKELRTFDITKLIKWNTETGAGYPLFNSINGVVSMMIPGSGSAAFEVPSPYRYKNFTVTARTASGINFFASFVNQTNYYYVDTVQYSELTSITGGSSYVSNTSSVPAKKYSFLIGDSIAINPEKISRLVFRSTSNFPDSLYISSVKASIYVDPTVVVKIDTTRIKLIDEKKSVKADTSYTTGFYGKKDTLIVTKTTTIRNDSLRIVKDSIIEGLVFKSDTVTTTVHDSITATDSLKLVYLTGIKGDFTGDSILDVRDFSYAAVLWGRSQNGASTKPEHELAPSVGKFPAILVNPDGKFDFRDLAVFIDFCYWNDEQFKTLPPLPQTMARSGSRKLTAKTEIIGDSAVIRIYGSTASINAAAFEISQPAVLWSKGEALLESGKVLAMNQKRGGISRFSQACISSFDDGQFEGELVSLTVPAALLAKGPITVKYALIDESQNVIASGTVDAAVEKAVKETIKKGVSFNAYPNPSVSEARGGEGFVFVVTSECEPAAVELTVLSPVGTLLHRAGTEAFRETEPGIFTTRWSADSFTNGSALAVVKVTNSEGKVIRHKMVLGTALEP